MLIGVFTVIHVFVCFMLILVVLLQKGKGQDFASTFGGGGTQTAFGARSGATILHRATTAAAVVFMVTSLTLTILMTRSGQNSVLGGDIEIETPLPDLPEVTLPGVGDEAEPVLELEEVDGGVLETEGDDLVAPEDAGVEQE